MKLIILAACAVALASCSLAYNPATGGVALTNDPVAVQAIADAATARLNAELAKKTAPKGTVVKVEAGK